ncbi:hypothetical protein OUZ56_003872 [Daphnia magna]|uniref:Uncharacterized protein n=1 Tax=Daphnia magna TaxID=35525 RepID=A0ABQ9YN24_9CRUS|nr:hypothetical protein OUZ56_003872 [Daphnia magna]
MAEEPQWRVGVRQCPFHWAGRRQVTTVFPQKQATPKYQQQKEEEDPPETTTIDDYIISNGGGWTSFDDTSAHLDGFSKSSALLSRIIEQSDEYVHCRCALLSLHNVYSALGYIDGLIDSDLLRRSSDARKQTPTINPKTTQFYSKTL